MYIYIHIYIQFFLDPPQMFVLVSILRSGLETATHPLRLYKTAFFWQEEYWLSSCVLYLVNPVSQWIKLDVLTFWWSGHI